jgi:putative membrane-bound dehydrogenase-like protein
MNRLGRILLFGLSLGLVWWTSCRQTPPAQTPEKLPDDQQRLAKNALKGLKIDQGLYATLFASEPVITNPTDIDIDARGRIWLCEGYNYRPELNPGDPVDSLGDKILILEDRDGDGRADTSKVFYQGNDVNAALGICVLGHQVIVSCSPKVLIFTDTDGDDRADKKEVLFEGIGGIQHDHGVHAFTFGPDGKFYFNFGNVGDSLLDKNGRVVTDPYGVAVNNREGTYRQGMVFRCNPDGSDLEVLGHNFRNPYEVAVDAFGNLWQSDNDDDGNKGVRINYVMKHGNYGFTDEMTGAGWRTARINQEDSIPLRHWHLNDPGVVPNLLQTGAGAPTGILVYEGDLLPEVFHNQIIHADALQHVVRSYPVKKSGAGYTADVVNVVEGIYDNWFRPSDVCVAPDGSLFIADWYDPGVGGHQVEDLNQGRIYRIAPPGVTYQVKPLDLKDPEGAVEALKNPNLATRYLAWQKLHGWGAKAIPALKKLYGSANPRYRARALWLLSKIPGQGINYVTEALKDKDENIRITAIRAAKELPVDIIPLVSGLVKDPSPQVRRTVAIALYHLKDARVPELWATLAGQYEGKDRWYLEALGIGAAGQWDACLAAWLKQTGDQWNTPAGRDIVWRARTQQALPLLVSMIEDPALDPEENLKYFRALDFYPDSSRQRILLSLIGNRFDHPRQSFIRAMALTQVDPGALPRTAATRTLISQSLESVRGRREFVTLVGKFAVKDRRSDLLDLAASAPQAEWRDQALGTLLDLGGKALVVARLHSDHTAAERLIEALGAQETKTNKDILESLVLEEKYPGALRQQAARALAKGWSGEDRMLRLVVSHRLPAEMDSLAAHLLMQASRSAVRDKAAAYFGLDSSRAALPPLATLMAQHGNAANGQEVFRTYCASCHRVSGQGTDFGPDLSAVGGKLAREAIYKAIITPDAGINFGFEGYTFRLKTGQTFTGYVTSRTPEETSVKVIGGEVKTLPVADIVSRTPYGRSLMPTGLATAMSRTQLVDLVEYLSQLGKP